MNIEDHMTDEERLCLNVAREHDKRMAAQAASIRTVTITPRPDSVGHGLTRLEIRDVAVKFMMESEPDAAIAIIATVLADRANEFSNSNVRAIQQIINDISWERI